MQIKVPRLRWTCCQTGRTLLEMKVFFPRKTRGEVLGVVLGTPRDQQEQQSIRKTSMLLCWNSLPLGWGKGQWLFCNYLHWWGGAHCLIASNCSTLQGRVASVYLCSLEWQEFPLCPGGMEQEPAGSCRERDGCSGGRRKKIKPRRKGGKKKKTKQEPKRNF